MGAGRTLHAKLFHRSVVLIELCSICSDALSHVRPTRPLFAKRRLPVLMARLVYCVVSWRERLATAAANTATRGDSRYNSDIIFVDPLAVLKLSRTTGATSDNVAAVALIPTQSGVTAFTRSAFARSASASAAHWSVDAATSFPSATATLPVYSAPIPMAADTVVMVDCGYCYCGCG